VTVTPSQDTVTVSPVGTPVTVKVTVPPPLRLLLFGAMLSTGVAFVIEAETELLVTWLWPSSATTQ
jgi:hypothetical protein